MRKRRGIMTNVHIHSPKPDQVGVARMWCHDRHCRRATYHVVRVVPWYGFDGCCMRCGRCWVSDDDTIILGELPPGRLATEYRRINKHRYRVGYKNQEVS